MLASDNKLGRLTSHDAQVIDNHYLTMASPVVPYLHVMPIMELIHNLYSTRVHGR